jgi:hydroxyacylglutathione hydrolase
MKVECFTVGAFSVNTYLLTDEVTGLSAIVDTGETRELVQRLRERRPAPNIAMILLTHAHLDHAGALAWLQEEWDVPTYMPRLELPLFETLPFQPRMFGFPGPDLPLGRVDHLIDDGFSVQLGETTLRFLSTPGHTPGQGCWFDDEHIIVGDTLFAGSIGRTDFPMSDPSLMVESLRRLMVLPGHLQVHSGHGPVTTLDHELRTNPFLGYIRRERGIDGARGFSWAPGT